MDKVQEALDFHILTYVDLDRARMAIDDFALLVCEVCISSLQTLYERDRMMMTSSIA